VKVNRDKLPVYAISGTEMQCGCRYGERWATEMLGFYYQELNPSADRLAYARRCWKHVQQAAPRSARFMKGMARGSGLALDQVTLLTLHEEVAHLPHCTAFAATGDATRGRKTLVAMNWDWAAQLYPWAGLLRLNAQGSPRVITYHYPGLWAGAGINEHGMALMWTSSGHMPRLKPKVGLPTYVVIAEILRRKTVAGALRWLDSIVHAGSFIFLLGDAGGEIAVVEGLPGYTVVDQSAEALSRANHYMCGDAVRRARQRLRRGKGVTTAYRAQRMARLVDEHVQQLGVRTAQEILTDRDGTGPWLHQFPWGPQRSTLSGMTIDSLLAVCEDGALYTCRGGGERGPWQRLRV
jgi:predicted choloylglycine hydrolase